MADDNQKIDTPSSFWGVGGSILSMLSLGAGIILIVNYGLLIAGIATIVTGLVIGLTCMGLGISKNSQVIENIVKKKSVSTVNGMSMHIGYAAEKQQNTEKRKDHLQSSKINIEQACISKKMVNDIKSQSLNK